MASTTKMVAEQFLQLGEDPPGIRLELAHGEIQLSPSPTPGHSYAEKAISFILMQYVNAHELGVVFGDVDTLLGAFNVRRPDILYFRKERLHLVGEKAMQGPPDLCVEILSPSSMETDREDKFELYASNGAAHYWIVDPIERNMEGYSLARGKFKLAGKGKGRETLRLPPFPDLEIPLKSLWFGK